MGEVELCRRRPFEGEVVEKGESVETKGGSEVETKGESGSEMKGKGGVR